MFSFKIELNLMMIFQVLKHQIYFYIKLKINRKIEKKLNPQHISTILFDAEIFYFEAKNE